jgi:flagellar hook-associated protein 3 FlgL
VRITDRMIFDQASANTARARDEAQAAASQASTGIRVQHPWDDPSAAGLIVRRRADVERMDAIGKVASRARDELDGSDMALGSMNDVLMRGRELAIQLANDTYSAEQRAAAGEEVKALLQQAISLGNTRVAGRYIFGGTQDASPPFDASGAYLGDTVVRQVEIAPGELQDAAIRADLVFGGAGGGTNVFATLAALAQALGSNDAVAVRGAIAGLDQSLTQVDQGRGSVGAAMNVLDTAIETSKLASDAATAAVAQLGDADVIAAASRLALAQRALDASLTASVRSFDLTILDKLK